MVEYEYSFVFKDDTRYDYVSIIASHNLKIIDVNGVKYHVKGLPSNVIKLQQNDCVISVTQLNMPPRDVNHIRRPIVSG